jgi:hypothetical protein
VAEALVKLVENPRREFYLSRLYDVPFILNRLFPGLVDFVTATWVRLKRQEELQEPHPSPTQPVHYQSSPFVLPAAVLLFAAVLLLKKRHKG